MADALVLGGGGITGIAWEIGVLVGLRDGGVDLTGADLIVGTSAGSVVGALVATGIDLDEMAEQQRAPDPRSHELGADFDADALAAALVPIMVGASSAQEVRARIGALALHASAVSEVERIGVISSRLPVQDWPARALQITGVDTADGRFVVWDKDANVPLLLAVAASCAVPGVWPPITIDGRRYMDGGVRSTTNADLVAGRGPVAILAPFTVGLSGSLDGEVAALGEASVAVVTPDARALEAIGPNPLDPSRRAAALDAGIAQAADASERVGMAWSAGR